MCHQCGKAIPHRGLKYCTTTCFYAWCRIHGWPRSGGVGGRSPTWTDGTCHHCGAKVYQRLSESTDRRYCSRKCLARGRPRRPRIPQVSCVCQECGNGFQRYRSRLTQGRGRFCSQVCHGVWRVRSSGRRVSLPETALFDALESQGVSVLRQHRIDTFVVDGYVPAWNLVIEVDGTYWHALPAMKQRDQRKDMRLSDLGYRIRRISIGRMQSRPGFDWSREIAMLIRWHGRSVA
jgi:very-short-patch-repair endonuclease